MSSTNFTLNILAALNKQLSKKQLQGDLKSMDNSMFIKVIAKLATSLSRKQLNKDLEKLNNLYVQIGANVSVDKDTKSQLQNKIKELQDSLAELEVNLKVSESKAVGEVDSVRKEIQAKASKAPIGFDIEVKRSKAIADIEYLGKRFSKLFSNVAAKQKYESILESAYSISDETQLKSVRNQVAEFTSELKANGLASQSLGDKWRNLIDRSKNLLSAASIVTTAFTQVKQAVSTFLQLDTAMTNLYKVTDDITSRDQFSGLLTKWNKLAQNLAVTTESLINSAAEWRKIGFNLDMSEQLAQITAIFEKTAEISNEKATSTLISAAQAFTEIGNLGEDDYVARVEAIGDRINAIGNKYSISSEGVAGGLQNASAALNVAGNDLDETIALITATNKIFYSPEEGSNMLKVTSMRLRGQVDALKEMGEDAEGVSTDITKIQRQIYELTGNKVNIFEDEDTLKSTYQIILEIGEVFDSLGDRSQADLLEKMFGKQRASAGAVLLLNYEELEKIKNDSMNAANSMAEEYSKYMESAEAHITIFKEKLVETYSTFINGDLIKYTADLGRGILDLVNSTDLLKHGIFAVLALKIGKGVTAVGAAIATTSKQMNTLGSALLQVRNLPVDSTRVDALEKVGNATKSLTEKNLKLLLSKKQLKDSDREMILSAHNLTEEEARAKLQKMGLTTATNTQSAANVKEAASTNVLKGAMGSLKASIIGVGTSIKTAFMSNPIGFILTGITTIVSIATTVISKNSQAMEEARQKVKELGEEFKSTKSDIDSYKSKIEGLRKTINDSSSSFDDVTQARKDLMVIQDELIKKYGTEEETVEKITEAINGQSDALDLLTRKQYLQWKNNFNDKKFRTSVSDLFSSRNIEFAFDKFIDLDFSGAWEALTYPTESNIDKMVSSMQHSYYTLEKTGNDALDSLIAKTYNLNSNGSKFELHGNLNDVYETLIEIQELASNFQVSSSFETSAEKLANSMYKTLETYMDSYDIYVLYEKILDNSKENQYDEQFYLINKAKEKYDEASILGDTDKIKEAADEYAQVLHSAINLATDNRDWDVADYFKSMYPELQQTFGEWEFSLNFEPNADGLKDKINNALDLIDGTSDGIAAFSVEDIENFNFDTATQEQINAYGDLSNAAESYGLTLKQLLSLLQAMGLVQSESYQQLLANFGQENVDKLLPEDLEIAYKINNVGSMTFEELQAEIQKTKEISDELPISFEDAWSGSFTSENSKVKELADTLLDLAAQGRLTTEAFNEADSTAGDYFKSLDISAEEAVSKINKLVDESSQLSSMSNHISKISEALGTKRDDGFVSAGTLSGFDAEIRGLDSWDRFQEVLGSTTSSYDECWEAANELATEWINNSDFLAQLTEQNKEYYETQLKAMGIENYEEIIAYAQELNSAKEALSQASFDLATATSEEIQALIADGEYTELAEQQIWALLLAKQTAQGADLDTADDCQRLLGLAKNAGVTGKAIELLTELMSIYNNLAHGIYGTNSEVLKEITTRAESIKQNILNLLSDNSSDTVELKPRIKFSPKAASSAGRSAAESFTDALDKELAALDKKMEAGYIDFNDYIQARLGLIEDYYAQGKLSADEYYSYLEKHYDTQLSYMDKVVNSVTRRIDTELDALKQQKEDVEDIYNVQIDSLEKEKTLLEETNRERQRQKDLQKSIYDTERARNQRTQLVYSEDKGMHYVADDQAVRDAQEDVYNARYDIQIAEIEKSVSNLEEARDKETSAIDDMISNLESYKDAWNDVTSAYTEEQENLIAAQILGANWEAYILNSRLDVLNDFKRQYISIQQEMADATWKFANEQANADFQAYASGTNNAKKGLNLVGEDGTEAYFDNHGHVAIVTKPTLIPMEGGEVVKNERDTKKLLDPDNLAPVDTIGLADIDGKEAEYTIKVNVETNGEIPNVRDASLANAETITLSDGTVLAPYNPDIDTSEFGKFYRAWNTTYGNIEKNVDESNRTLSQHLIVEHNQQMNEGLNRFINNSSSVVNNNRNMQQPVNNTFNITMPNVTNSTSAERLMNDLQSLGRKKFQVDWNK